MREGTDYIFSGIFSWINMSCMLVKDNSRAEQSRTKRRARLKEGKEKNKEVESRSR